MTVNIFEMEGHLFDWGFFFTRGHLFDKKGHLFDRKGHLIQEGSHFFQSLNFQHTLSPFSGQLIQTLLRYCLVAY